jgi:hypothetical protein
VLIVGIHKSVVIFDACSFDQWKYTKSTLMPSPILSLDVYSQFAFVQTEQNIHCLSARDLEPVYTIMAADLCLMKRGIAFNSHDVAFSSRCFGRNEIRIYDLTTGTARLSVDMMMNVPSVLAMDIMQVI